MENKEPSKICRIFCWALACTSWLVLNSILLFLIYHGINNGSSSELMLIIIITTVSLNVGIIVGVFRAFGVKIKLGEKDKPFKDSKFGS